jgi:uncharacterized protein
MRPRVISFLLLPVLASLATAAEIETSHAKLAETIQSGRRAKALDMIAKKSAGVNVPEADGSTALLWAAHLNDADLVARLLKAGAKPNVRNRLGSTPLSEAALNANTPMLKMLLDAGADPNAAGPDGQTALMVIARTADVDAAMLLLTKGADPNAREKQRGQNALMWAAANSQGAMMRVLLDHGAEVDAASDADLMTPLVSSEPRAQPRPPGGETAMLFATREGCMDCVKTVVEHGAKLDLADPEGVTPLITAIFNTRFDVAKYLIEKGADVNKWDWWGRTPLYLAVDYNTLPHGGRPDQPALDETLPIDIVKMLLDKGANPNAQLKLFPPYRATGNDRGLDTMISIGTTPLLRAAKGLDVPAIKLLLDHGALLDLANSAGWTPMVAAAGMGSVDADTRGYFTTSDVEARSIASLELLLAHGGNINEKAGRFESTALDGASFWGWNKVVEYLLSKGADINQTDSRGYTPVDYAMGRAQGNSRGGQRKDVHQNTADLLMSKGGKAGAPIKQPAGGHAAL